MKKWLLFPLIPLALLLTAGFYIYHTVTFVHAPPALNDKEKRMVNTLFATTKNQCVGRYVFTVPATFDNTLTDRAQIDDISISSKRLYRPAFEQRIQLREQALKNSITVDPIDKPFLKHVYRLSENAVIFDRNRNESVPGFGRILEGHLYIDGVAFILTTEIRDVSDPKYHQDRISYLKGGMSEIEINNNPRKRAELQDLMSRLSGRKNDDIPTQPGTCISEGFIHDGKTKSKEDITFVYRHHPVFSLSVSTNTYPGDAKSMLERSNEIQPYLNQINARTLRKGKIQTGNINADEWLNTAASEKSPDNPSAQLLFNLIANEKIVDFYHPVIDLTLSNHALPPPAYSDAELVEIWDRITRSFHLRHNAF